MEASDQTLLDIEAKLEEDVLEINKELLRARDACVAALDKINGRIVHVDEKTSSRLDGLHIAESAVKRRLYVKLALLGQKLNTVSTAQQILKDVMVLGVPQYVDAVDPPSPPSSAESEQGRSIPMETESSSCSPAPDRRPSTVKPVDTGIDHHHGEDIHRTQRRAKRHHNDHSSPGPQSFGPGDVVFYVEHRGGPAVRASIVSTFNDSCVVQIASSRQIKQVPYSSLEPLHS